jgi:hypothetical protein
MLSFNLWVWLATIEISNLPSMDFLNKKQPALILCIHDSYVGIKDPLAYFGITWFYSLH